MDYKEYPNLLVFSRSDGKKSFEVFLNFGSEKLEIKLPAIRKSIFALTGATISSDSKLELAANSGIVLVV